MANGWQGTFPEKDQAEDGYAGLAPVRSYPPNVYRLHDMAGNVAEWVEDWYQKDYYLNAARKNPKGPETSLDEDEPLVWKRVVRGGSYLSNDLQDRGLRCGTRDKLAPGVGWQHVGFRCARDAKPTESGRKSGGR
jgi:formylglycine-generating enzyme required for sulfatase activity